MPAVPEELIRLRAEIDAHLEVYLKQLPTDLDIAISPNGEQALTLLTEFALRPGKRLRGALAMVSYKMFGGTDHQAALDVAVAIELAQDYLLIIDDVMDRSDTRRGRPTVHRQYREVLAREHRSADAGHLGDMLGISVGLIAQHLSSRLLGNAGESPERVVRAQQVFQQNIAATAFGQMDDLMNQASERFSMEDTRRMYVLKSGYYTFVNPLQLGAVLAGAKEAELEPIRTFGEYAGLAFQLQDDLLGMFGDESATGKSAMDDMHEGKMTLLIRHALEAANTRQLEQLRASYGNPHATRQQHRQVCAILTELGSREFVAHEAQEAAQTGQAVLAAQNAWKADGKRCLSELLEYVVNRGE